MSTQVLFPTLVYQARLRFRGWRTLNERLRRESLQLRREDAAGRRWSVQHYPGGYTSYASAHRMQQHSPTFAALARRLDVHVAAFTRALQLDVRAQAGDDRLLGQCHGEGAAHGLHLHPLATISGTYYVAAPLGVAGLKFEDPRLERFMAAPPRLRGARRANRPWVTLPVRTGGLLLFESWLRHEVPPARYAGDRISVSFNYGWS